METTEVKKEEMKTLFDCINTLVRNGFTEYYKMSPKGLKALKREKIYSPEEVKIVNFYRFEGDSDPADNSILYAIETNDVNRGTLVDAYSAYADAKISTFMHQVEDINKKTTKGASL
jgi:hypothetical protein